MVSEVGVENTEDNYVLDRGSLSFAILQVLIDRGVPVNISDKKDIVLRPTDEAYLIFKQVVETPDYKALRDASRGREPDFVQTSFDEDTKKKLSALHFDSAKRGRNVDYASILANSIIDEFVETLKDWKVIFDSYQLKVSYAFNLTAKI